mmetsp:Transcript_70516/g.153163  ORF Transcript_70516/g.153163 Transcript_70516/m.153163 type:complete len:217 (-) Transcript_70516:483-1133(-)
MPSRGLIQGPQSSKVIRGLAEAPLASKGGLVEFGEAHPASASGVHFLELLLHRGANRIPEIAKGLDHAIDHGVRVFEREAPVHGIPLAGARAAGGVASMLEALDGPADVAHDGCPFLEGAHPTFGFILHRPHHVRRGREHPTNHEVLHDRGQSLLADSSLHLPLRIDVVEDLAPRVGDEMLDDHHHSYCILHSVAVDKVLTVQEFLDIARRKAIDV